MDALETYFEIVDFFLLLLIRVSVFLDSYSFMN